MPLLRGSTPCPVNKSLKPAEYRGILDSPAGRVKRCKRVRKREKLSGE